MIEKYIISKDEKYYRAFTDLIEVNGKLICVFSEMNNETKESNICFSQSIDNGINWSDRKVFQTKFGDNGRWDCSRLSKLKDGKIIMLSTWYLNGDKTKKDSYVYMWTFDNSFKLINGPIKTTINGIVPDKITELDDRWITSTHENNNGKRETYLYTSFDQGNTWNKTLLAKSNIYDVCETSIITLDNNTLVALMRENSHQGIDCLKTISYDKGESWSDIYRMPIPACHRPVISKLNSGNYLITYRFDYAKFVGTGVHGNIFMGCICTKENLLEIDRDKIVPRIFPIDYDRNINSNCGYSGQVQLDDDSIYVTAHIVDDNPVGHIRGYKLKKKFNHKEVNMIKRIYDEISANYCDTLLTKLIQDEKQYDNTIDEKFVVKDYFKNIIQDERNILLCYEEDNKIIGYTFLKPIEVNKEHAYIINGIYVEEEYRNKKIATKLIEESLKMLKEKNIKIVEINAFCKNEKALNLYKKFGFKETKVLMRLE